MNFSFLVEIGFAGGLITGFALGSTYRGLLDKWKFRKQKTKGE